MSGLEPVERRTYNKIVRDNIPDIIARKGGLAETVVVTSAEALELLKQKLVEEAEEIIAAEPDHLIEELADALEVIQAIAEEAGVPLAKVEEARVQKREERGGFSQRIKLIAS